MLLAGGFAEPVEKESRGCMKREDTLCHQRKAEHGGCCPVSTTDWQAPRGLTAEHPGSAS